MNRRAALALAITIAVSLDMISTYLMIASGYREATGLIVMMLDASLLLLIAWPLLWGLGFYWLYPLAQKHKLTIHLETIILYFAIMSTLAAIGNGYLYLKYGVMA